MSEWVSDSEISAKLGHKIILAGLSEAGKTACKRIFFLKQRTESVDSLGATINYERMSVIIKGIPINIVDLGGQKVFLNRFLNNFSPFVFSSVKIFIFLIDVDNKTTRNNAISYYSACRDRLNKYSPNARIFVFLHKNDLLRNSPNYESIHEQLKEQFQLEYPDEEVKFFRTTIYRPETVINAFGRIFELVIPEIAESEFVDGHVIGPIEEFAKQKITIGERISKTEISQMEATTSIISTKTDSKTEFGEITHKSSYQKQTTDNPEVLNRLQKLMRQATYESSISESEISINKTSQILQNKSNALMNVKPGKIEEHETITSEKETQIEPFQLESKKELEFKSDNEKLNRLIRHLIGFYGLDIKQAKDIIQKGYVDIFELVAATGIIDTSLITNVLLKYIPFIQNKGLKIENLTNDRLLDIFIALLNRWVQEDDAIKFIIFAVQRPNLSIKEIIELYFVKPKIKAIKSDKSNIQQIKTYDLAKIDIPVETVGIDGIIRIPETPLGFKIIKDDLNAKISFYYIGQKDDKKEEIGHSIISTSISVSEIIYLMAYELNMVDLGIFDKGKDSLEFCAKIVYEAIKHLDNNKFMPLEQTDGKKLGISTTFNFIVPIEIEMNGDYIKLPDSQDVAFTLEKHKQGFKLSFIQRGFPIGSTIISDTCTINMINELLLEKMQIPMESDGARNFAARVIHATANNFLIASKIADSRKEPITLEIPKTASEKIIDDDKTSEHLKYYLDLLERG